MQNEHGIQQGEFEGEILIRMQLQTTLNSPNYGNLMRLSFSSDEISLFCPGTHDKYIYIGPTFHSLQTQDLIIWIIYNHFICAMAVPDQYSLVFNRLICSRV